MRDDRFARGRPRGRGSARAGLVLLPLAAVVIAGCSTTERPTTPRAPSPPSASPVAGMHAPAAPSEPSGTQMFSDITDAIGLTFVHDAGLDGTAFLPEIMGGGVALFDADADGFLDAYFLNGGRHAFPRGPRAARNRLFLMGADGRFAEAPGALGLDDAGYGQGVAVGDIDGDGDLDVHVANYGPDALFRRDPAGHTDITTAAGLSDGSWGAATAFLDFDADGWLDLFVGHYVAHDPQVAWLDASGRRVYCGPDSYDGEPSALYRGLGRGLYDLVAIAWYQRRRFKPVPVEHTPAPR